MTAELTSLTLIAIFAASLWIPYIVLSSQSANDGLQTFDRMAPVWKMTDITQRAYRAHMNLLEQSLPFAIVVVVAHLANVSNSITVGASVAFVVLRVLHAVGYIAGWARMPLRPLIFVAGWVCILLIAVTILLA